MASHCQTYKDSCLGQLLERGPMSVIHSVGLFQLWREKYPDWQSLCAFLESEEGGYLRIMDESDTTCIIRYDKGHSRMELPHVRWCRSIIWDKLRHCPLSVAPPKASIEIFPYTDMGITEAIDKINRGQLTVEKYTDGFMIQVYQVKGDSTVQIATRSKRDASGTFYSAKTFRTLFLDAYEGDCNELAMSEWDKEGTDEEGTDRVVARFWSYMVQHPEHRVVTPVPSARIHLIQRGQIDITGRVSLWNGFPSLSLKTVLSDSQASDETLLECVHRISQTRPWWFRGIVIKDTSGERWRFRSEKYMAIQSLRGSESNTYERYARIFTQNLSGTYFEYYPEDIIPFSLCGVFINDTVHTLYRLYHTVHVRRTSTLAQVHRVYRHHLYGIHGIYLSRLRPVEKWVTIHDIRMYLMSQPPSRVAFLIRHHQEEYHSRVAQVV